MGATVIKVWQFWMVKLFYPEYFEAAMKLCEELGKYYGRDKSEFNEAMIIYTSFGREDFEVGFEEQSCGVCAKD